MTSKKMWIVGGIVVAIGAAAYLSYSSPPASSDVAGTIVEANRTVTDGATAANTDQTAPATDASAAAAATGQAATDASAAADASSAANGTDNGKPHGKAGKAAKSGKDGKAAMSGKNGKE